MTSPLKSILAASAFVFATAAHAELPFGTLTFIQPTGTVAPGETIDVWVRFTLSEDSPALSFSSSPFSGFSDADLPTEGSYYNTDTESYETRPVAAITGAYLNTYFNCSDTFTGGCNGDTSNYSYSFHLASEPGKPSINFVEAFTLAPGESFDYVFAQFTPAAGGAAPGTYRFDDTGFTLSFRGHDIDGNELEINSITLASTCASYESSCAFTRVVEVPEPTTYAMMAFGLLAVAAASRRYRA